MIELAAAGWNLLPNEEVQRLLDDGAELAAEHGLRAVELRARILRLGAASEAAPLTVSDEYVIAETSAALRELEELDDPRALATALCAPGRERVLARALRRRARIGGPRARHVAGGGRGLGVGGLRF